MDYKYFGVMICCSANGVVRVDRVKRLIDYLSMMDYNLLEICIDDIYKIEDEPYFGYLRGGYTKEELREMDEYAKSKGIKLVPCIQTLAHLTNLVKLPKYWDIVDVNDILLIDEPKTYELIEKMFKSLRNSLSTDVINIGMDEAHMVGLGKYLDKHGYKNRSELLLKHLEKVIDIAKKYGFKAHMWSDMFFRLANGGAYYGEDVEISEAVAKKVPLNVELCYWDYGEICAGDWKNYDLEKQERIYAKMFSEHKKFNREIWFAGGVWNWNGFTPQNKMAQTLMKPAFKQVIKNQVKNVLVTIWGDDGNDCSYFESLPTLYALREYSKGNFDEESIKNGFKEIFNYSFDDFMLLDIPNFNSGNPEGLKRESATKTLLYNDCFLGWKDNYIQKLQPIDFVKRSEILKNAEERVGEFKYIFECASALCYALDKKATLGVRTRKAYREKNITQLEKIIDDYSETAKRIDYFRIKFRELWFKEYKANGWEIQQYRLGGLVSRLLDCRDRLLDYLKGKIDCIEELEEEILPYGDNALQHNAFCGLISVNNI